MIIIEIIDALIQILIPFGLFICAGYNTIEAIVAKEFRGKYIKYATLFWLLLIIYFAIIFLSCLSTGIWP